MGRDLEDPKGTGATAKERRVIEETLKQRQERVKAGQEWARSPEGQKTLKDGQKKVEEAMKKLMRPRRLPRANCRCGRHCFG